MFYTWLYIVIDYFFFHGWENVKRPISDHMSKIHWSYLELNLMENG